ncbi:MAG: nuclear transport factor 2 family protein [Proteobacteria bacterium]|nr:nuclear transport factor 2 family protein [Pseudomonadota bacterium]
MPARIFPTAQDAEAAFYEALERSDLELMMAVWSEDEDIVCIHPGGERLVGQDQVRDSWRQIFAAGTRARLHVTRQVAIAGPMVAVHSLHENFSVPGEKHPLQPVVATNVYLRTAAGWRMIAHHGSPAPGSAEPPPPPPKILH